MSAADNTGRRGMYFYQCCRLSVWTGGSPPQKKQCVSEPGLPWGGWALSQIDGAEWQPERDGGMWGSFTLSLEQRIETERRLHPLSPGRILSIALHLDPPHALFCAHIQNVQIRKKKKKININMWMTEHAQCGTNPVTLSAGVIREAERGCCLDLWVSDRKEKVWTDKLKLRRWPEWQGSRGTLYQRARAWQQVETDNLIHLNSISS